MSHAVLRGKPTVSQLYLDGILNEVLVSRKRSTDAEGRGRVSLPQILYHCMAKNPEGIFMINGGTGEKITNAQMLKLAIPLARKLESEGARGKVATVSMFNDQTKFAVYLALLFAGVVPFFFYYSNTIYEITYFLKLIEPSLVICGDEYLKDMKTALENLPELKPDIMLSNTLPEPLKELDVASFQIPDTCVEGMVMLIPTSGSTGLPKAGMMTHRGFVAQLPAAWHRYTRFPTPMDLAMIMTSPAGVLFHRMFTSCIAYSVPVLSPYDSRSEEWVKTALLTHRPSWLQITPVLFKTFLTSITVDHLSSLQCLKIGGSHLSDKNKAVLMALLPKSAVLEETYGSTETLSIVACNENNKSLRLTNVFEYKLIDEDGNTLGLCATGELCVKGPSIAKGYYKNNTKILEDGWCRTGDIFYVDEEESLFFQTRIKHSFKCKNSAALVSPEEIEDVINSIPGVSACVVSYTELGITALVEATGVTRDQVYEAVKHNLSSYKHLNGVCFIAAIPYLVSGKMDRIKCSKIIQQLIASGECY